MDHWQPICVCAILIGLGAAPAPAAAESPIAVSNATSNPVVTAAATIGAPIKASADVPGAGPVESPVLAPDDIPVVSPAYAQPDTPVDSPTNVPPDLPLEAPAYPPADAPKPTGSNPYSFLSFLNSGTFSSKDSNFWATGDYLFSWIRASAYPALATTSPAGTARSAAGVLGAPGTGTLFGGTLNDTVRPGFRLGTGYWFDDQHSLGIEAGFTMMSTESALFGITSPGSPILARPFNDTATGTPQAVLVAYPGSSSGALDIRASSGNFFGGNLDLTEKIFDAGWVRFNSIAGYQAYGYSEGLYMQQTIFPTGAGFVPGTRIDSIDNFSTHNTFHGLDLGMRTEFFWNSLGVELLTKVAIGNLHTSISTTGLQTTTVPGSPPLAVPGGVYALPSNMGSFSNNFFTAVPQFGLSLKWQVLNDVQLRVGYSLLWINGVARTGNEVNTTINTNNFPPATNVVPNSQPSFLLNRSDLWVQSINVGLTWSY